MSAEFSDMTKYWIALSSVRGVGPRTMRKLVNRFGSPEKALSAPVIEIARMLRLNLELAIEISGVRRNLVGIEAFIAQTTRAGIDILCPDSGEYPDQLKLIGDFPPILYKMGTELPKDKTSVAIVGTRSLSSDAAKAAGRMAERLAKSGIVIVSGLARGIDTAAHKGALKAGGETLAVLGSGLKMVYPTENRQLANDICVNGSILSECHPSEAVSGQKLIRRNRITSGLSSGVILVEPGRGALNTAEMALRQGKYVFMYDSGNGRISTASLPEKTLIIRGIDELDSVLDRLKMKKDIGDQMYLL